MIKDEGLNNKPQDIGERVFNFAVRILKMTQSLQKTYVNIAILNQIIRSATSIGANIEEARGAHTKTDFTYGMNIAKKEARETFYWLRLIAEMNHLFSNKLELLLRENEEIIKILTSIVKKAKPRTFVS
jgi:four helix bundle protein